MDRDFGPTKYVFNGDYHEYINPCSQDWSIGYSASLLLHEIGHTLTLRHTWVGNDGCNDTPDGATYDALINGNCVARNANCWANDIDLNICPISQGGNGYQPCHHWENISNNMMDYNQWEPHAVTTCQIDRINDDLINGGNMFVHSCNGCMPSQAFFELPRTHKLCPQNSVGGPLYLNGQGSFNEDVWLIEICQVKPTNLTDCLSGHVTTGWNNGQIGKIDLRNFYNFQVGRTYKVKLTVDNIYAELNDKGETIPPCPPSDVHVEYVTISKCIEGPIGGSVMGMSATSPFSQDLNILYYLEEPGKFQLRLVNMFTNQVMIVEPENEKVEGDYQIGFNTSFLPSGIYSLQAIFNENITSQTIVKP